MKNLKLPLTQSAGYIYDASGQLIGRFFDATDLKAYEVDYIADITVTALNTLINGLDKYRALSDSISNMENLIQNISDPRERHPLENEVERAHKAKKALFINSKLISKIVKAS